MFTINRIASLQQSFLWSETQKHPQIYFTLFVLLLFTLQPFFTWQQPLDLETLHLTLAQVIYGTKLSHVEDRALVAALVRTILSLALGVTQEAAKDWDAAREERSGGAAEEATPAREGDAQGKAEEDVGGELRVAYDDPGLDIEQECSKEFKSTAEEATKGRGTSGCDDASGTKLFESEGLPGPREEEVSALARERFMKRLRKELQPLFKALPCKVADLPKLILVRIARK